MIMNVYQELQDFSKTTYKPMKDDLQSLIFESFTNFFNTALNVNVTVADLSFKIFGITAGDKISLQYQYKYGCLTFSVTPEYFFVDFHLYKSAIKKLETPFDADHFVVYADTTMCYQYAEFDQVFHLRFNQLFCSSLQFFYLKLPNSVENELEVTLLQGDKQNEVFTLKEYVSMNLSTRYSTMDKPFRDYLTKFLTLSEFKPEIFYAVFTNYAELIGQFNDHSNVIEFLNMFEKHYAENLEDLDAKLLVCTMNSI